MAGETTLRVETISSSLSEWREPPGPIFLLPRPGGLSFLCAGLGLFLYAAIYKAALDALDGPMAGNNFLRTKKLLCMVNKNA